MSCPGERRGDRPSESRDDTGRQDMGSTSIEDSIGKTRWLEREREREYLKTVQKRKKNMTFMLAPVHKASQDRIHDAGPSPETRERKLR